MKTMLILLISWAGLTLANPPPPLRILPIGDSITRGSYIARYTDGIYSNQVVGLPNPNGGGWRKVLQDKLRKAGIACEFVGELDYNAYGTNGVVDPNFNPHHHGLAGFSNQGILSGGVVPTPQDVLDAKGVPQISVPGIVTVIKKHQPNVILLMSGANGFDALARDRLIRTIASNTTARIMVATIPPECLPRAGWEQVDAYNQSLPQIVSTLHAAGHTIQLVDIHAALSTDDLLTDGVHPNSTGMAKIADAWFVALSSHRL